MRVKPYVFLFSLFPFHSSHVVPTENFYDGGAQWIPVPATRASQKRLRKTGTTGTEQHESPHQQLPLTHPHPPTLPHHQGVDGWTLSTPEAMNPQLGSY